VDSRVPLAAAVALGVALNWPRLPAAAPASAPPEQFSATRALVPLAPWATAPRPTGSPAHAAVLDSLSATLTATGFEVRRELSPDGRLVNLVAAAPGAPVGGVWLTAHSDSVPRGPGAADDGLGLAVVTEAARALSVGGVPAGLHVLITDGEELGLYGAKAHVAADRAASGEGERASRLVLNVEARGTEGPAYMFQTAGTEGELLQAWRESGCRAQATSLAHSIYAVLPNDTDFTIFRRAGWWGYDFALIDGAWRYHTPEDTLANLSPASVQAVGDCVTGLARAWLGRELGLGEPKPEAARVYAQVGGVTVEAPGWAVRLAAALPLLLLRPSRRVLAGAGAWALALVAAIGLAIFTMAPLAAFWPGFATRPAEALHPYPLFGFAVALGLGCAVGAFRALRRFSPIGGWLDLAAVGAAATAIFLPAAGYALVPGAWASALRARGHERAAVAAALAAGLLLGPVLLGACVGLTSRMLPVLAVLPLLTVGWLLPRGAAIGNQPRPQPRGP